MRIIGGKYKGHPLVHFKASHIRPTTDRVKESLFNIWQGMLDDSVVLDLFSGTGSLGLEALSRGAKQVVFVEKNRQSIDILKRNIQQLKIKDGYAIVQKDVLTFLKAYQGEPFDLVLADPPFTEKMAHEVIEGIAASKVFHQNTLMAIESSSHEKMEDLYPPLHRSDFRKYGDKFLSLFQVEPNAVS